MVSKKSQYRSQKYWSQKLSLGIFLYENFGLITQWPLFLPAWIRPWLITFTSFPMSQATWIGFLPFLSAMPGLLGQRIRTHDKTTKFNLLYLAPSDKSNSRDFLWNIRHSYIYPNTVLSKYAPIICPNIVKLSKSNVTYHSPTQLGAKVTLDLDHIDN